MIHTIADFIFSRICHQEAIRCWAPCGNVLAFCQRCTGVYVGSSLMLLLIPLMKFRPNKKILWLHGLFMIQMIVFGFHLIPHSATIRTISGQLFITGVIYFLYHNLQNRWNLFKINQSPQYYLYGIVLNIILLQLFVRAPFPFASTIIELLGLIGIMVIIVFGFITLFDLCTIKFKKHQKQKI
jgi:uncharacterized membrane protein